MSSGNRHRPRRKSNERSTYGSRQDVTSSRYANDPPPRFANRRTNGDSPRDSWDGYQARREGGQRQQNRVGSFDDNAVNQLLSKLDQCTDADKYTRVIRQLQDLLENADQRVISRNINGFIDSLQYGIETFYKSSSATVILEQCLCLLTISLGRESHILFDWIFQRVHSEETTDDIRAVYLSGLQKSLQSDVDKQSFSASFHYIAENLQSVLEVADTPQLLEVVVRNLLHIAKVTPQSISPHFKNTVDILVGWHIDTNQDESLITFIADSLVSLHQYWIEDITFSVDLLKQFLEDMDAYTNELAGGSNKAPVLPDEQSTPEECLSKLTALLHVFTTVLKALGVYFSPSRSNVTPADVKNVVSRILHYVMLSINVSFCEDLLIIGNECLCQLSACLQAHFAAFCPDLINYIFCQFDYQDFLSNELALSLVKLLLQMAEDLQSSLPTQFLQRLLSIDSPFMLTRFNNNAEVLKTLLDFFRTLLSVRNIPILETVYKLLLADLEHAMQILDKSFHDPLYGASSDISTFEAQAIAIFDITVLSHVAKASKPIIGMWSPTPTVFYLLTSYLNILTPDMASEYPPVHFALLYSLFQDWLNNGHYISSSTESAFKPVGTSSSSSVSSLSYSGGSLSDIIQILSTQLHKFTLSYDICHLIQRWMADITDCIISNKEIQQDLQPLLDTLCMELLALSFSREHSVRLDNASVLKTLLQHRIVSDKAIKKCVPEIVMRLCDTKGEIRAAYSALLEVVPTHVITSFNNGVEEFHPPNGRKGIEGLRNCKGTHHARHLHLTKPSQVTFHGHHFRAIMGFIMNGLAPSKHLPDDWLERMYHSCQHRRPPPPDSLDHPETHPMLMSQLVCNCDALLWFWATYESAQYCLLARLKTPLGSPNDTFRALENVIRGYAQEVDFNGAKNNRDTPSSFTGHSGAGLGPRHYTVHLRAVLLLQFMEHLDKLMYNAYEGSCVTLPMVPKAVKGFFRKNMEVCLSWLNNIRSYLVSMAIHSGLPAVALRHGFSALQNHVRSRTTQSPEFSKMLVSVVHALIQLNSWEAIRGMGGWLKDVTGACPQWITAAEAQAKGSFETACDDYRKSLELQPTADVYVQNFVNDKICECYICLGEWKDAEEWHRRASLQPFPHSYQEPDGGSLSYDINKIQALSAFEEGNMTLMKTCLENQVESRHWSRDPEVVPLWDPNKLLSTSEVLLLRAATLQGDSHAPSDDDDANSTASDDYTTSIQRWLKLASAYAESPLRVGCLEWPLRLSSYHALQLQASSAFRLITPIKSRHSAPGASSLILHGLPMKCLNPIHHDNSIWNTALRYTSHLAGTSISQQNHTPSLLLEAYRLARKHNNLKLARSLIQRHILGLVQNNSNEMGLSGAVENMHSSISLSPQEKFHVMRELSKLYACLGQTSEAVDSLTTSISTFCESQAKTRDSGPGQRQLPGNELTGRGLLTLVKWLQSDTRLLGTLWHPEFETGKKLESLLTQEMECRRLRLGLYQNTDAIESSDLFQPDSSVARFDKHEYGIGQLLHLATIHCPNLAKAWWLLAGWSYRIGRKNLEALSSTGTAELLQHEQKEVDRILGHLVLSEERIGILKVLGQVHIADDSTDEDLKDKEQLKSLDMEEDTKSVKGQLLSVCPSLESLPSLDPLLAIWHGVRKRMFMHYQLSARAYFHFLKLSGEQAGSSPGLDDMNVTASLRLLRLLVKYAGELKSELENGFAATPTKPWKGIIPQLFSRLNHPEANVRQSVSDLLCRVGQDSPHYIIYPAIVGASKGAEKKSSFSGILGGHGGDEKETEESYSSSNIESNNMLGDQYSPPDDTLQGNMDEPVETSSMELSNLDKCLSVIVDSLTQKNPEMVKAVRDLVAELCRITLLWDEMWLAALMQRQGEVHRRLMQIEAELKRTLSIPNHLLTPEAKDAIMKQKYVATMKPLLWVLEYLAAVTAQPPETLNERQFQVEYGDLISIAIQKLQNPSNYKVSHNVWDPFKQLQQMLMHRAQKRMQSPLSLNEISPHLAAIQSSCISMPGHTQQDEPVLLESFCLDVSVLPTKTKPKKISMIGSDGRKHTYLFKGLEDLHLDERIMQFMAIVNNMFAKAHKHQTQLYLARDYAVIPLGARSGLIQWVDNVTPLFGIYKRWQQREALAKAMQQAGSQPNAPVQVLIRKPNELFYSKIIPLLNEKGLTEQTPRKDWPTSIQLRVLKELMNETPRDLLAKELWCASSCASEWWSVTQTYCRSTAVMCMIGYIIGLGDRHLDNLLVDFSTGQVVHVDYNVCFEKGKSLRVPERVPFRMTQNIEAALGFTGVEGLFRISCEDILRILRRGRETLLTLLEAFVYDPLIDWTQSEEAAFPLAMRTTAELKVRQTRKEMEWEVAEGMLITKLAESEPHWQKNRENLCSVLLALEKHLNDIASTSNQMVTYQEKISKLDKEVSILHDATTTPNHPLISMQDRLTEQSRLAAEHKRLNMLIQEKRSDSVDWNEKYKNVFIMLHSAEKGTKLHEIAAQLQEPLNLGSSGHEPAVEFLQKTGQAHTVESCDQLEEELLLLLQRRRNVMQSALEALNQYRTITAQFPNKYLEQCRSYLWEHCLDDIVIGDKEITHDKYLKVIDSFEGLLGPAPPTRLIMATDNKLRKQIQEQHVKFQKLTDRAQNLSSIDMKRLEIGVTEAYQNLQKFCLDNPDNGPHSLACFIVLALCPLSRRWLFMEQTARAARERLSDLTSREGDWFMDELCTMSGNVSQMARTLEFCLNSLDKDPHSGTIVRTCLDSVMSVHEVYSAMIDLVNKFYSLVMPEVSKSIVKDDPTFIEMLDNIADIKLSMFPELSLPDGLRKLHEQLRQCALKNVPADLTTTAAVEDLKIKLSSIMFSTDSEEGEDAGNVLQLTQGQVILNGLSGLFETIEKCTLNMLDNVENITVPDEWRVVDLIKQTKEVMCTTAGLFLKEDLLFVRKVSSIVDFCAECKNFMKAFKLEHNTHEGEYLDLVSPPGTPSRRSSSVPVPTDHQFSHPIRRYISETLVCHVLGQPSYSLTALLVSTITQYLDVPVHFNKPITIEDLCKIANDHCQTVLSLGVIQNARNLFSLHDIAWREWDKARRLTTNLENCKQSIQRLKNVTMRFQWLHEESLIVPDSVHAWVGHQRSALLTTIKKVLSEQLATSINNVIEKIHSQQFRISQRLQWAAGANSALNTIIDEFQRICNHHKSMLEKEEAIFNDMEEIAKAIIHLESSHTRIPAQTSSDRETIQILQRCGDVTLKLKLCAEELSQLSDIMPHLQLPCDGSPLNKEWIQRRLDEASNERNKLQNDKKFANNKVVKNKENVLSELEKLRSLNRQHRKLLVEVWQQLTALAKLEEPPPSGQLQPGPRAFINHQNKFGEETKGYIQSTQDLIASDMSLTSKPSWTSKARAEEFRQLGAMAATLRSLAEWLLGQLLSFTEQLFYGQPLGKLKWNDPLQIDSSISMKSRSSNLSVASQSGQQNLESEQQSRIYRSSQGIVRDLRTGKALQEQNSYAVGVWRRVKGKLDGRDPDPAYRMTVSEQVKFVIEEATSFENLCQLYEGWTPWV